MLLNFTLIEDQEYFFFKVLFATATQSSNEYWSWVKLFFYLAVLQLIDFEYRSSNLC